MSDARLEKYLIGLAVIRAEQRQVAAAHWEIEQKLDDLNKRLDALQRGDHEPLFCESFGRSSAFEAATLPRWLN